MPVRVVDRLAAAAADIEGHEIGSALEILLDVYAATRGHQLITPIEACSQRMTHWRAPKVDHGVEVAVWEMEAMNCHPADLGALIAAVPRRGVAKLVTVAGYRSPDPRLGRALIELFHDEPESSTGADISLLRKIVRHGDDKVLAELEHAGPAHATYRHLELFEIPPPLTLEVLAALDEVMAALTVTPKIAPLETIGVVDPHVSIVVRELAIVRTLGAPRERSGRDSKGAPRSGRDSRNPSKPAVIDVPTGDVTSTLPTHIGRDLHDDLVVGSAAQIGFASDDTFLASPRDLAAAAPALIRLLDLPAHPARFAILRLLAEPWRDRDFFSRFPDLDGELATIIDDGWPTYLRLLDDPDPAIQAAALTVLAHLHVPLRDFELAALYRSHAGAAAGPSSQAGRPAELRAAFLVAAGRVWRDDTRDWPLEASDPVMRFAAAIGEALCRRSVITREALAIVETVAAAPSAMVEPTLFPWFGGDVAAMARAVIAWLELPSIDEVLDVVEGRIRAGGAPADVERDGWQLARLIPRVFGRSMSRRPARASTVSYDGPGTGQNSPGGGPLSSTQQRLVAMLAFVRSKQLGDLDVPVPSPEEVRRILGIAGRTLKIPTSRPFSEWSLDDDVLLVQRAHHPTEIANIDAALDSKQRTTFLDVHTELDECPSVLEYCGAVAMVGDEHLASWLADGHPCESLRILSLWGIPSTHTIEGLAQASILEQLRWLVIRFIDASTLVRSPLLDNLELLDWRWPDDSHVLCELRSRLRKLVVMGVVSIDAIAANPSFVLEQLVVDQSRLVGTGAIGAEAFRHLRRFSAVASSVGDDDLRWLARCSRLERIDLRDTAVRDLGAISTLAELPDLVELTLPFRPRLELWLTHRELRGVTLPDDKERDAWRPRVIPRPATPASAAATQLPAPPAGVTRRFVHEVLSVCWDCGGTGRRPDGPCAMHEDTREIRYAGDAPFDVRHGVQLAASASAVHIAERHAVELARLLGLAPVIWWRFDRDDPRAYPPPASRHADEILEKGRLGGTVMWPIARLVDMPDDPIARAAVAIVDAGFSIPHLGDDGVHLAMHGITT